MATTYDAVLPAASNSTVVHQQATAANLVLLSTSVNGGGQVSTYVFSDTPADHPVKVEFRKGSDPKTGGARFSVRLIAPVERTKDDGLVDYPEMEVVIAVNSPTAVLQVPADALTLIGMAFGLLYTAKDGGNVPTATVMNKVSFGQTQLY
jgi:hypothetical protein